MSVRDHTSGPAFMSNYRVPKTAKCGVYDLESMEWKQGKEYEYDGNKYKNWFNCAVANSGQYDMDKCYILNNLGRTDEYDMAKDEWVNLCNEYEKDMDFIGNKVALWLENPSVLYYFGEPGMRVFDIRDDKGKWLKYDEKGISGHVFV